MAGSNASGLSDSRSSRPCRTPITIPASVSTDTWRLMGTARAKSDSFCVP
jgi:hypothetical protein